MRQIRYRPYVILAVTLLALLSLPLTMTQQIRGVAIACVAPLWSRLDSVQSCVREPWRAWKERRQVTDLSSELAALKLENHRLRSELDELTELRAHAELLDLFKMQAQQAGIGELREQLAIQLQAIPAKVIYRSPASWHSTLWINQVVAKNSPVVVGTSIIGIVDDVGSHQSRVRLITDPGLTPSVRALRQDTLLAKGEIHGSGAPLWKGTGKKLKGVGFNYDFTDEQGPARDLRTGTPTDPSIKTPPVAILQEGDLLVTTGMDGVFPAGLHVGKVTKVKNLQEGSYTYEIEAEPTAGDLTDLSMVFVIPPSNADRQVDPS